MMSTTIRKSEREEAIERLHSWIKPGDKLRTILRHTSRSGMSRIIDVVKFNGEDVLSLGYNIALALDNRYDREREGVKVGGCGMDMGFNLIYNLSYTLWPNGFDCIGENCPANDHTNGSPDKYHMDGGYALRQAWL